MKRLYGLVTALVLVAFGAAAQAAGTLTGGEKYDIPSWFKQSFLELAEDAEEAAEADKHALVFIHSPE